MNEDCSLMAGFALSFVTRHSCFFAVSEKYAGTCSVNVLSVRDEAASIGNGKGAKQTGESCNQMSFYGSRLK